MSLFTGNKQEKEKIKQAACWDDGFSEAPESAMWLRSLGPELDVHPLYQGGKNETSYL